MTAPYQLTPDPPPRGEDLPYDDGEPMETPRHREQMNLLIESLNLAWAHRDDFYAGGNMFVYFSQTQAKKNDFRGPDFFLVLDTDRHERKSWVVWEEDGRTPDVVVEITSPSTEAVDRGEKLRIYSRILHVSYYYIYDPYTHGLDGYRLEQRDYRPILADEAGRLGCDIVGLSLGVARGPFLRAQREDVPYLRWFDSVGTLLLDPVELAQAEAQRADTEARRADTEARHVGELEARIAAYEKAFGPLPK